MTKNKIDITKKVRRRYSDFDLAGELNSRINSICLLFRSPDAQVSTLKVFEIFLSEFSLLSLESHDPGEYRRKMLFTIGEWIAQQASRKPVLVKAVADLIKFYARAWQLNEKPLSTDKVD